MKLRVPDALERALSMSLSYNASLKLFTNRYFGQLYNTRFQNHRGGDSFLVSSSES